MSYLVKLEQFEGPLDLLLHLISKAKVRIEDISITEITQQYMDTLDAMQQFDIEIASEFLVMAATLLHIKSCLLVPKAKPEPEDEASDLKDELITRLLEYKRFKEASGMLQKREAYFSEIYSKLPEEFYFDREQDALPEGIDPKALYAALYKLLSKVRTPERLPMIHQIRRDPVSVNERISQLKAFFIECGETTFSKLFNDYMTREDIIVTFLALLEMLKENEITLHQDYPFEDFTVKRSKANG